MGSNRTQFSQGNNKTQSGGLCCNFLVSILSYSLGFIFLVHPLRLTWPWLLLSPLLRLGRSPQYLSLLLQKDTNNFIECESRRWWGFPKGRLSEWNDIYLESEWVVNYSLIWWRHWALESSRRRRRTRIRKPWDRTHSKRIWAANLPPTTILFCTRGVPIISHSCDQMFLRFLKQQPPPPSPLEQIWVPLSAAPPPSVQCPAIVFLERKALTQIRGFLKEIRKGDSI